MSYCAICWLQPTASSLLSFRHVNPVTSELVTGSSLCKLRPLSKFHTCREEQRTQCPLGGVKMHIAVFYLFFFQKRTLMVPLQAAVISRLWEESSAKQVTSSSPCAFKMWSLLLPVSTSHVNTDESPCPVTSSLRVGLYRAQDRRAGLPPPLLLCCETPDQSPSPPLPSASGSRAR